MNRILVCFLLLIGTTSCMTSKSTHQPYWYDNGPDFVVEGMYRIVDEEGKMGFANVKGQVVIKPQFAFVFPFKNGVAKATFEGRSREVAESRGEYHYWDSPSWFYIDQKGNIVSAKTNN
ncbi:MULTISPECIES: WG repeat-containing protein [unclassified Myroides]|uniref:WG repeat-containing protein n=1 Tax=unclassified Myroides TaxID=2642485 RepID=UPI003D2F91EE